MLLVQALCIRLIVPYSNATSKTKADVSDFDSTDGYLCNIINHAYSTDKEPIVGCVFGKQKSWHLTPFQEQILC